MTSVDAARDFLQREGRIVERRLFAVLLDGASPGPVVDAVRAHRNDDGGFGHAMEPDKRVPASQPLDVEHALETLDAASAWDDGLAAGACDFLASIAAPDGSVPLLLPSALEFPQSP